MKPNYNYRKDFLDRTILIGDEVIICEPKYHNFVCGVVTKFTPKGIKVKFKDHNEYEKETFCFNGEFIYLENKYKEKYREDRKGD